MAPWDEPSSRTCYDSKMAFLQMEKEKAANKDAKEKMNNIRELFPSLDDEEVLEEKTYEKIYEEYLDEFYHVEYPDDTFDEDEAVTAVLPLDEDVNAFTPPTHEDKEMFTFVDALVREPLHMVDEHIDTFIQTGISKWDFGRLIFDRVPIYDIEGSPQENGFELSSS